MNKNDTSCLTIKIIFEIKKELSPAYEFNIRKTMTINPKKYSEYVFKYFYKKGSKIVIKYKISDQTKFLFG